MNTKIDYIFRTESPWIYVGPGESARNEMIPSYFYSNPEMNICVRQLLGKRMRTVDSLMNEFAAALQFFEGFGNNWHALTECLEYMDEWLPSDAYILVIEGAEELLISEADEAVGYFLDVLHRVGEWWAKPITDNGRFNRKSIPFHVLIHVSDTVGSERIIAAACAQKIPIRQSN